MYYAVTHLTVYKYSNPITDSVMEIRKQPRTEGKQRNLRFELDVSPHAKVDSYKDYMGNTIHNFDIPAAHTSLAVKANAIVEIKDFELLPDALDMSAWDILDEQAENYEFHDMLLAGQYAKTTQRLQQFAKEIGVSRYADPLTVLSDMTMNIYNAFEYTQHITKVDSPIDVALEGRRGVCQDFTHIMLAMARSIGIPARYVSGYLFHRQDKDRSDNDASHAWVEAWLPELGWVGFDPTNNLIAQNRHIRVCVANDYANASPARGVFKGDADTALEVKVQVSELPEVPVDEAPLAPEIVMPQYTYYQAQQQQQQ